MAMANSDVREFSGQMPFIISMHDDEEPTISLGERVVYLGTDEPEHGTIRWIGKLPEISDGLTVGVELDNAVGAIDGVWGGKKLFACKSMHGIVIDVKGLIKEVDFFGDDVDAASDSTTIPLTETPMAEAVKQHEDVSGSNDAGSEIRGLTGKDILQQMEDVRKQHKSQNKSKGVPNMNNVPVTSETCEKGNATLNKLYKQLEISILNGNADDAAVLARQLAQSKIQTSVAENQSLVQAMDDSKVFLNMFVEDNVSHHGPIPIQVSSSMTVGELKKKIFREFEFPTGVQRWILGRKLANCDSDKLDHFGVDFNGCPVFLYITNPGNVDVKASDLLWDNDKREMEKMQAKTVSSQLKRESEATARQLEALKRDQLEMKPSQYCDDLLNNLLQPNSNLNTFQAGWHCSMCTLVNVPTRPGCEVCGFSRPAEYKVPEAYQMQESERIRLEEEEKVDRALELTLKEAEEKQRNENLQNYIQLMKLEEQDFVMNENAFECNICFCDIEPHEGVKLRDCLHMFCRDCLSNTVTYSDEATVKCPYRDEEYSCTSVLQEREIRALVSAEAFERHLQKSVVTAESQAQNSFHCKTPDCKGWCLYDDNVNEFHCPVCRRNNCLTCRVIHEGMNCRQYQDRLAAICTADEEAQKTKQAIDDMLKTGEALHCPNCNIIIMKKWGCDWICCSVCKLEICWVTKQPRWGPRGHGDTSSGCRCGLKGVRCHPNCNYCH